MRTANSAALVLVAALAALAAPRVSRAQDLDAIDCSGAVITNMNGQVKLGVRTDGSLNAMPCGPFEAGQKMSVEGVELIGLRYVDTEGLVDDENVGAEYEATTGGRPNEAWGVAYQCDGEDGMRKAYSKAEENPEDADHQPVAEPLRVTAGCLDDDDASDCYSVTSTVVADECLRVQHSYTAVAGENAFEVKVDATNLCEPDIVRLQYSRTMDWDIEPSSFEEMVVNEPGNSADLVCLNLNGDCTGDPTADCPGECATSRVETDAPGDYGATFLFDFKSISADEPLPMGQTKTIRMFYGSAASPATVDNTINRLKVEAYSIARSTFPDKPVAHFFAFANISGEIVFPPPPGTPTVPCDCKSAVGGTVGTRVGILFRPEGPYTDFGCRS